jgi:hypothetical protein
MLHYIIPSKARRKILTLFFHSPQEHFYLRRVVREVNEEVNAVKRELDILHNGKVLVKERRLNKVFYALNKNYVFYDEFMRIFAKTTLLGELVRKNISKIGKTKFIALSTRFVKQTEGKTEDIHLLFVGVIVVPEIVEIVNQVEKELKREINYTVMTEDELAYRKKNNDPFIWKFLRQPKVMLVGLEEDLMK